MKKILMLNIFVIVIGLLSFTIIPNINVKAYGFGFKKNDNHMQPQIGTYSNVINGTDSYYVGNKDEKVLYLTFDVGYDDGTLSSILDTLKEKEVKATFFVTGDFVNRQQELLNRIVNEGHVVGNHTYGHKDITKLSSLQIKEELEKLENKFTEVTGKQMVKYFRPPEGSFDKESLMAIKSLGYKTFFWSIAYVDWNADRQNGSDYCYNTIMKNLHNGGIILLHTVSKDNTESLGRIIDDSRNLGYEFKELEHLIRE